MTVVASVMMLDFLDIERQISRPKEILYIVENSITLLLSLMFFWFVCVKKRNDFCTELCFSVEVLLMCLNGLKCAQNARKLTLHNGFNKNDIRASAKISHALWQTPIYLFL